MPTFQYHPEIISHFSDLRSAIILVYAVTNAPTSPSLGELYRAEQVSTIGRIAGAPLSEIITLAAWRKTFRSFGVDPTKYRSAPEALLRRLTKKGDIPSINTIVDITNLVSIRYALPVASFDTRSIQGPVSVHFADGSERFKPLGSSLIEFPEKGEVIFSDETDMVVARRWCWRQSDESAARSDTRNLIITIEAQHETSLDEVQAARRDILDLLSEYAGGTYKTSLLGPDNLYI